MMTSNSPNQLDSLSDISTDSRSPLQVMFSPRSVAVVGAGPDLGKPAGRCLAFLRRYGFGGRIFPINPKYDDIDGLTCYPNFTSLPDSVELVVLIVPAASVPGHLQAAASAGAKAAVVCSSGFAETGEAGAELQRDVVEMAERLGMAVLGPNCLGLVDLHSGLVASFSSALAGDCDLAPGPTAFVSQSGAMGMAVFTLAQREGVRVGKFVSTGNEAVQDFTDFIEYLSADPNTSLVLGYMEGLRDGRRFVSASRELRAAGKALAVLKVGESEVGQRAAQSHTGALAGSNAAYAAAFRRAGVIVADDISHLLDLAVVAPGARRASGRSIGLITMSGGAGVMMSDACSRYGLEVSELSSSTCDVLAKVLPPYVGTGNPVDFGAIYDNLDAVFTCIEAVANDPGVAQVLLFIGLSPNLVGRIEKRLAAVQHSAGKPLLVVWLGGPVEGLRALRAHGIAAFDEPRRAVRAAANLADIGTPIAGPDVALEAEPGGERGKTTRALLQGYIDEGRSTLSEREVKDLLRAYELPLVEETFVRNGVEAAVVAARIGRSMAIKAEAPDLLHKSDAGAVRLNVPVAQAGDAVEAVIAAAANVVGRAGVRGALLQPMALPGLELLAGIRFDPQFGPTLTVGLGGVTSEVMADVTTELAPVDLLTARSMLDRLRGARLLGEFRGTPPRDVESTARALVSLSEFAIDAGSLVAELDLNPVIVHEVGQGCTIVDGAAVLASSTN